MISVTCLLCNRSSKKAFDDIFSNVGANDHRVQDGISSFQNAHVIEDYNCHKGPFTSSDSDATVTLL